MENKTYKIIIGVLVVLLAAALCVICFLLGRDSKKEEPKKDVETKEVEKKEETKKEEPGFTAFAGTKATADLEVKGVKKNGSKKTK